MLEAAMQVLMSLSVYLASQGLHVSGVDIQHDTFFVKVDRRGRTEEEIETIVREARVVISLTYIFMLNTIACPSVRYKIVEHEDYIR